MSAHNVTKFGPHLHQQRFDSTFQDCMKLVEETAEYLDHEGRKASKLLGWQDAARYAGESMRLTTRLMNLAAWMMIERNRREIGHVKSPGELERIRDELAARTAPLKTFERLPKEFTDLVRRTYSMQSRIMMLDQTRES